MLVGTKKKFGVYKAKTRIIQYICIQIFTRSFDHLKTILEMTVVQNRMVNGTNDTNV